MNKKIDRILSDLYQIDSSFKKHEKELRIIIKKILVSQPDTKFDKNFARQLRAQLVDKAAELKTDKKPSAIELIINSLTMKKLSYAAAGAVLTLIIMIPVIYTLTKPKGEDLPTFLTGLQISKIADSAFGNLSGSDEQLGAAQGIGSAQPRTQSGGGGGVAVPTAPRVNSEIGQLVPPDYVAVNYKYVYKGEPIILDQEKLSVLKRLKGSSNAGQLSSLLNNFDLGLADLSGFSDSKVQNISFIQDKTFGYMINANLDEGALTIYQNWSKWPRPECRDEKCWQEQRLTINDIPADESLIKIADGFLAKNKISRENYGQPFIDNNWRLWYDQAENKADYYVPEALTVNYPLQIKGQQVFEGSGYPVSLSVSVDIKNKKVNSVTSLTTQNYQSSDYAAETDASRIMSWVEKGGIYSYNYGDDQDTYEVEVGEPKLGFFKKWVYQNDTNDELLVPALIFPVINKPDIQEINGRIMPDINKLNVVVPLITEVLDEFEQGQDDIIRIEPMPAVDVGTNSPEEQSAPPAIRNEEDEVLQ